MTPPGANLEPHDGTGRVQLSFTVADGQDKKVVILDRNTLAPAGTIGQGGRQPGRFLAVGSIAVDSRGNVYTGEQHHGKRVQKFVTGR